MALTEYRAESNPARLFLEERFTFNAEMWVVCEDVYRPYVDWSKANGFLPLSAGSFGHEIRRAFPKVERKQLMASGERFMAYLGIAKR